MKHWKLLALMAVGLALRLALMPLPDPYDFDLTTFWLPWMAFGAKYGLAQLYLYGEPVVNYPPFFLALLINLGKLYGLLQPGFDYTPLQSVLIKLPAVVADLAVGALIYFAALRSADRGSGAPRALLAAGLWLLNPATIYVSSYWAQVDAIHTLWMVAALLAALDKRWGWSGLLIAFGLLTKLQAVIILPLLLLLAWWNGWRAVGRWSAALVGMVGLGVLAPLVAGALDPVINAYTGSVGFYPALSMNAYNPWFVVQFASAQILGEPLLDTAQVVGSVTLRWIGIAMLAGYGLLILWVLNRRWRPRPADWVAWPAAGLQLDAFFAAGLLVFGFFTLATEMHERYILPALAFMALPAALSRGRLLAFVLLSGAVFLNLLRVLPFAPAVSQIYAWLPGDRVVISLAMTGLFAWWTLLYLRDANVATGLWTTSVGSDN